MELQAVADHQLDPVGLGGADHAAALVGHDGHRLLAQDVDAGAGRFHGVVAVHRVRSEQIDGVDVVALQALPELVVVIRGGPELLRGRLRARTVVGDDRDQPGVFGGPSEGRKHSTQRDVAQTHHGVSDLFRHPAVLFQRFCNGKLQARGHGGTDGQGVRSGALLMPLGFVTG